MTAFAFIAILLGIIKIIVTFGIIKIINNQLFLTVDISEQSLINFGLFLGVDGIIEIFCGLFILI